MDQFHDSRFQRWNRKRQREIDNRPNRRLSDDSEYDSSERGSPQRRRCEDGDDSSSSHDEDSEPEQIQQHAHQPHEEHSDDEASDRGSQGSGGERVGEEDGNENENRSGNGDENRGEEESGDEHENHEDIGNNEDNLQAIGGVYEEEVREMGDDGDANGFERGSEDEQEGSDNEAEESGNENGEPSEISDSDTGIDSSAAEEEDEEEENVDNLPLFDGAQVTFRQSLMAILTFAVTHKLSGVCIGDLLSLIALHCGRNSICLKTLYLFKKYFSMIGKNLIDCYYYCSGCEVALDRKESVCDTCQGRYNVTYFISFPIVTQLQSMYARPGFKESLSFPRSRVKKNPNNLEDIYDGEIYQEQVNNGFLANPNNISFFMYFDGVSIFKNSKFSIWPLYLSINELRYIERVKKENTVLAGIWFGKAKPNSNLFLNPLQRQMRTLETDGVELSLPDNLRVTVKAKILGAVGDLPAKALFMRMLQFNGLHSCFNCLSSGGRYDLGNTTIQVFPYSRNFEIRTKEDMLRFADLAVTARQRDPDASIYGVKGPSLLSCLLPNLVDCLGIDIMHGVFLGIMKTVINLWFGGEYSNYPFSVAAFVDIIDKRIEKIKPPSSFQRIPRSIQKEIGLFKAYDYKVFMLFYSLPVLLGILPNIYWIHHCKIVSAISLLSQESVSLEQINVAEELLHSYVRDFQELYGVRFLGLNVHQLLHLCAVVRKLGPLWVYSCFFYESLNGDIAGLVHGTRYVALQISSSSAIFMNLSVMINSMDDCDAKSLCLKFRNPGRKLLKIGEVIDHRTCVIGKYKSCNPVPRDIQRLVYDAFGMINGGQYNYFFRLKKKGILYCSEQYVRSKQKLSCYAEISDNGIPYLCKINSFLKWRSCGPRCAAECADCRSIFMCIVTLYDRVLWEVQENNIILPNINKVVCTNVSRAFSINAIRSICLYIPVSDEESFMALPPNSLEIE